MSVTYEIELVFSLFHDGVIEECSGISDKLIIKISCPYLAELINKAFESFYVELKNVTRFYFEGFYKADENNSRVINDLNEFSGIELEIMGSEIEDDYVKVFCFCHPATDLSCGYLYIMANGVEVFDQQYKLIGIQQLKGLAEKYWTDLKNRGSN